MGVNAKNISVEKSTSDDAISTLTAIMIYADKKASEAMEANKSAAEVQAAYDEAFEKAYMNLGVLTDFISIKDSLLGEKQEGSIKDTCEVILRLDTPEKLEKFNHLRVSGRVDADTKERLKSFNFVNWDEYKQSLDKQKQSDAVLANIQDIVLQNDNINPFDVYATVKTLTVGSKTRVNSKNAKTKFIAFDTGVTVKIQGLVIGEKPSFFDFIITNKNATYRTLASNVTSTESLIRFFYTDFIYDEDKNALDTLETQDIRGLDNLLTELKYEYNNTITDSKLKLGEADSSSEFCHNLVTLDSWVNNKNLIVTANMTIEECEKCYLTNCAKNTGFVNMIYELITSYRAKILNFIQYEEAGIGNVSQK